MSIAVHCAPRNVSVRYICRLRGVAADGGTSRYVEDMTHSQTHGLPAWPDDDAADLRAALTLADSAAAFIRAASGVEYLDSLLVLGTGWRGVLESLAGGQSTHGSAMGELADGDDDLAEVVWRSEATAVPGFVEPSAEANHAELLVVRIGLDDDLEDGERRHVLVQTGCPHVYDGYGVHAPVHSVRVAAALGAERAVFTSDCGSLRDDIAPGAVMLVRDHLNPTFATPLVGPAFVDLRGMWSANLAELAREHEPELRDACYAFVPGPQYQTPSEVRMLRSGGADCVGMSMVPGALAARERGMEIVGLSVVSSAETSDEPNDPVAVLRAAREATGRHAGLLQHLLTVD